MNPLSSQMQSRCSLGIMALWLVEGIRLEAPGYPSLNPLCFGPGAATGDWIQVSESNRRTAVAAYRRWWKHAATLPEADRRAGDPLSGTGLYWY